MADSPSSYKIKPLDGASTYPTWSIKLMDILTEADLYEYVFGSKTSRPIITPQREVTVPGNTPNAPSTKKIIPAVTESDLEDWNSKQ
jgi:hypothetical protein